MRRNIKEGGGGGTTAFFVYLYLHVYRYNVISIGLYDGEEWYKSSAKMILGLVTLEKSKEYLSGNKYNLANFFLSTLL